MVDFLFEIPVLILNMVHTFFENLSSIFTVNGNDYSLIALLGGTGILALIIWSIVKT